MESVTLKTWIYVTQAKTLKVFFGNLEMSAKDNLSRFSLQLSVTFGKLRDEGGGEFWEVSLERGQKFGSRSTNQLHEQLLLPLLTSLIHVCLIIIGKNTNRQRPLYSSSAACRLEDPGGSLPTA